LLEDEDEKGKKKEKRPENSRCKAGIQTAVRRLNLEKKMAARDPQNITVEKVSEDICKNIVLPLIRNMECFDVMK